MSVIIHHNDADGRCAAAIVLLAEPGSHALVEMDYKDPTPNDIILLGDKVIIVDFSFKPEEFAKLYAKTPNIIWVDHHKTAAHYDYGVEVAGLRDFGEPGRSGCELTWLYYFPGKPVPKAVALLGDYDAWRLETKPVCFQFYEGLKLENQSPYSPMWRRLFDDSSETDRLTERGTTAIRYRDNYCGELRRAFGYVTKIGGFSAYALNTYRFGSPGFGECFDQYPVCIAYIHDGSDFTVSLYSKTVDVGEIAKAHGGGGHKGAAGFVCRELPFRKGDKT